MLNALPSWFAPPTPVTGHTPNAGNAAHGEDAAASRGGFAGVLSQAKVPHDAAPVCKPAQPARPTDSASPPEPETPSDEATPTNALPPKPASRGIAALGAKPRPAPPGGKLDKAHSASPADDSHADETSGTADKRSASAADDAADALPIDPLVLEAAARAAAKDAKAALSSAPATSGDVAAAALNDGTNSGTNTGTNTGTDTDTDTNTGTNTGANAVSAPLPAAGQVQTTIDMTHSATTDKAVVAAVPLAPMAAVSTLAPPVTAAQERADASDSPASLNSSRFMASRLLGDAGAAPAVAHGNAAPVPSPGAAATGAAIGAASPKDLEIAAAANTPPQAAEGASANSQPTPVAALSFAAGLADALGPKAGAHASATAEVRVPAAVNSPEFAPALGMTLSTLAANGVHEARLQLHPAELGPITVQIAVDGTGARIDFQADVAQTRQAIEDSLPSLAGALREAGLTLTGGGVSQHSRQPEQPGQPGARSGTRGASGSANDDLAAIGSAVSRTVQRRGLVDLLA